MLTMAEMFADEDAARFFQMVQMLQRSTFCRWATCPTSPAPTITTWARREGIEVLRMFQRKTEGNLSSKKRRCFVPSSANFRCNSPGAATKATRQEEAQSDVIRETFSQPQDGPVEDLSTPVKGEEE